ncbi:hypothetical protein [Ruegeria lacuscaerulensis]|uniref:hypothetical protein n=1 Tax=Ruegeria lacuscaerulensis TaxID=55218 RepID=UPI00147E70A2|nr:hypothetical protein [Ruegeria lacuscaerulensis]
MLFGSDQGERTRLYAGAWTAALYVVAMSGLLLFPLVVGGYEMSGDSAAFMWWTTHLSLALVGEIPFNANIGAEKNLFFSLPAAIVAALTGLRSVETYVITYWVICWCPLPFLYAGLVGIFRIPDTFDWMTGCVLASLPLIVISTLGYFTDIAAFTAVLAGAVALGHGLRRNNTILIALGLFFVMCGVTTRLSNAPYFACCGVLFLWLMRAELIHNWLRFLTGFGIALLTYVPIALALDVPETTRNLIALRAELGATIWAYDNYGSDFGVDNVVAKRFNTFILWNLELYWPLLCLWAVQWYLSFVHRDLRSLAFHAVTTSTMVGLTLLLAFVAIENPRYLLPMALLPILALASSNTDERARRQPTGFAAMLASLLIRLRLQYAAVLAGVLFLWQAVPLIQMTAQSARYDWYLPARSFLLLGSTPVMQMVLDQVETQTPSEAPRVLVSPMVLTTPRASQLSNWQLAHRDMSGLRAEQAARFRTPLIVPRSTAAPPIAALTAEGELAALSTAELLLLTNPADPDELKNYSHAMSTTVAEAMRKVKQAGQMSEMGLAPISRIALPSESPDTHETILLEVVDADRWHNWLIMVGCPVLDGLDVRTPRCGSLKLGPDKVKLEVDERTYLSSASVAFNLDGTPHISIQTEGIELGTTHLVFVHALPDDLSYACPFIAKSAPAPGHDNQVAFRVTETEATMLTTCNYTIRLGIYHTQNDTHEFWRTGS